MVIIFVLATSDKGLRAAMRGDPHVLVGLDVHRGQVTHIEVAKALGLAHADAGAAVTS